MSTYPIETLREFLHVSPFIQHWNLGIDAADANAQTLAMTMPWRPEGETHRGTGVWHGGAIASLIDTAGCFAAIMMWGKDAGTVAMNVDYLRAAKGALRAEARVRKIGRTLGNVEVDVLDEAQRLVAVGRGVFHTSA